MKRYALILALVMALAAGFGCAKKTQDATGDVDDMSPEMRAAIQQITDGRVLFAFDKFDIQPQYKDMLTAKAELMKKYLALGERRARAAYDYMVRLGVNPGQLEMISYGKEKPVVQGSGESVWAQNRRDDFCVIAH